MPNESVRPGPASLRVHSYQPSITEPLLKRILIPFALVALCAASIEAQTISWTAISRLPDDFAVAMNVDSSGYVYADIGTRAYRSTNGGMNWTEVNAGRFAVAPDGRLYSVTGASVEFSNDAGETWTRVQPFAPDMATIDVRQLAINELGDLFVATNGRGLFRSSDRGNSWESLRARIDDSVVLSIAFDELGIVYAGTESGIYWSDDFGDTWDILLEDFVPMPVVSLHVTTTGVLLAGTGAAGMVRVGADIWQFVDPTQIESTTSVLSIVEGRDGNLFAGTDKGIYLSTDDGESWRKVNRGIENVAAFPALAVTRNGDVLAAGVDGNIYSTGGASSIGEMDRTGGMQAPRIARDGGNEYRVMFETMGSGPVSIELRDLLGRNVLSIPAHQVQTGRNEVRFAVDGLPRGTYLCRVTGNNQSGVARFVLR